MTESYFIKSSFKPNKVIRIKSETKFWKIDKIPSSRIYLQYHVYKFAKKVIKKRNLNSILDIGCGSAIKLMRLVYPTCKHVYGINEGAIIEYCRKNYDINTFYKDDIEKPRLDLDKKFDMIISSDVIEHLENPDNLVKYIKKYSHENTYIIISTPERDTLRGKSTTSTPNKSHVREWNRKELSEYLRSRNLKILYHNLIKSFRITLYFRQPYLGIKQDFKKHLGLIFRHSIRNFKHTQIVVCKVENSFCVKNELNNKLFQQTIIQKLIDRLDIVNVIFHMILYAIISKDPSLILKKLKRLLRFKAK